MQSMPYISDKTVINAKPLFHEIEGHHIPLNVSYLFVKHVIQFAANNFRNSSYVDNDINDTKQTKDLA